MLHTYIGVAMQIDYKLGGDDDGGDGLISTTTIPGAGAAGDDKERRGRRLRRVQELFQTRLDFGHEDYFAKKWDEVICEHSPYFPAGVCILQASFTFLTID